MERHFSQYFKGLLILLLSLQAITGCVDGDLLSPDTEAPEISDFTPKSGIPGTEVLLQGKNFGGSPGMDSVFINGSGAEVTSSNTTRITFLVPVEATTGPILVENLSTRKRIITREDFEVLAIAPSGISITGILPSAGVIGSSFSVFGAGFGSNPDDISVFIGEVSTQVREAADTAISTFVPLGAITGPISISSGGDTALGPVFAVLDAGPEIDTLMPVHGPVGSIVWIYGQYFSSVPEQNVIAFNGVNSEILEAYNDSIKTRVPETATSGKVMVTVNGKSAEWPLFTVDVTGPVITGIDPSSGKEGSKVTITGNNFGATPAENMVSFNGVTATISDASVNQIVVVVPEGATTGPLSVTVGDITVEGPVFTVEATPPEITSIEPNSGQTGAKVTINGSNFSSTPAENKVTFNGVSASVTSATSIQLEVVVPVGATTGPVVVTVNGLASNMVNFTVEASPPQIGSISPLSGPYNTQVTISGTNFSDQIASNHVYFNGNEAVITSASATELVATVPLGAGTGPVTVTTNGLSDTGPVFNYIKTAFVNTLAGDGNAGFVDGPGLSARFNGASRMAVNASGEIIVADFNNHSIRMINSKGDVITLAGDGNSGLVNGAGAQARFARPFGVAVDKSGNIFVADFDNNLIRRISTTNVVSIYAGTGQPGFSNGTLNSASFNGPIDIAVDDAGNLFVADFYNHAIRRIDINGNVTTLAGSGSAGFVDSKGTAASFNNPVGIGIDPSGNVLVADLANHAIRSVDQAGNVTTVSGNGTAGSADGPVAAARFNFPYDVDTDASGNMYVADDKNHKIRVIRTNGSVETLAGSGTEGFLDGEAPDARFNDPVGILVISGELMYVGDSENHRIRIITFE